MAKISECCDIDISPKYDGENVTVFFVGDRGDEKVDLLELVLTPEEAGILGNLLVLASKVETDGPCFGMKAVKYSKEDKA